MEPPNEVQPSRLYHHASRPGEARHLRPSAQRRENRPPRFRQSRAPRVLESSRRGMRCPLSLGERARVRGNETPPTKTAGRILPAQLDRFSESGLATTSSAKLVDGRRARGRKRIGVSSVASPSPRPLPWGEGEPYATLAPIQSGWTRRGAGCGVPSPWGRGQG